MSAKQPARRPRAQASSTDDSAATPRPKASRRAISKAAPAQVAAVTAAPPFDPAASLLPGIAPIGRIPVQDVRPLVDGGTRPAKAVVHETFTITATVFREGHDAVNATAVLTDPEGVDHPVPMTCVNPGLNTWVAEVTPTSAGWWTCRVEGWSDPYGTWEHDGTIKVDAGVDVELMLEEGARVIERAIGAWPVTVEPVPAVLPDAVLALRDTTRPAQARLRAGTADGVRAALARHPLREMVSTSPRYRLLVERELALFGAWYEFFPRSEGCRFDAATGTWASGTLRTAEQRLPAVAAMGFDVIYLTPIHPIGSAAKKGKNNTLGGGPDDPGSPYAIGSPDGGHDAIHPDLGTFADFDHFVAAAADLGLEVAMDLALQCSPDHPWVTDHPEWFTTRADGTIAYAENPPKKYQDIYPMNFDNDPAGIYAEVRRVIQVWVDHGVKIFRVDNPHTKPVEFWQWLIADVAKDHPEVIWLAEAFTKPAMMHTLGKAGFQQSYTYYAWRNQKWELEEYCRELAGDAATYMRPSFWPTTHDILTPYMQYGGPTAWKLRAALAALLVPTYGIYAGYELMESVARPGAEEQVDNEKYEYKDRRWSDYEPGGPKAGRTLAPYLTMLNRVRAQHPALRWLRNLRFHAVDDANIMCFSKSRVMPDGQRDTVIVVANLDPHATRESVVHLTMPELGLGWTETFRVHDHVTDQTWVWGENNYLRLGPDSEPVHILTVVPW